MLNIIILKWNMKNYKENCCDLRWTSLINNLKFGWDKIINWYVKCQSSDKLHKFSNQVK